MWKRRRKRWMRCMRAGRNWRRRRTRAKARDYIWGMLVPNVVAGFSPRWPIIEDFEPLKAENTSFGKKGVDLGFAERIPGDGGCSDDGPVRAAGGPGNAALRICRFHHSGRTVLRSNARCRSESGDRGLAVKS